MNYIEIKPCEELSYFVKCFWKYSNPQSDIHHTIFPNGHFELFLIYEKQQLVSFFISGLRTEAFDVLVPQDVTIYAVRFKLAAAEYLFHKEMNKIVNTILPLESHLFSMNTMDFLPFEEAIAELSDRLLKNIDWQNINPEKIILLETVYIADLKVKDVSEKTGWSSRKINRYFNKQFGFPLKTFLNIIRLRSSFPHIKRGDLFPEHDYFDQSHYIKEIKKYTGKLPKQLHKNKDDRFLQFTVNKES